jgi:putative transposon-encoded protein
VLAKVRSRLTYANVLATVALFVALGGTGYAVISLPKNSVGKRQIERKAVRSPEAYNLRLRDFKKGQRAKLKGDPGQQGIQGEQGPQGEPGTARAYAVIDPDGCTTAAGSCSIFQAKNVVGARRAQPGFYCVTVGPGIDRLTAGSMAGVDWDGTTVPAGNASAIVFPRDYIGASVCPGQEFTVATERTTSGSSSNLVDNVAFWFAVP